SWGGGGGGVCGGGGFAPGWSEHPAVIARSTVTRATSSSRRRLTGEFTSFVAMRRDGLGRPQARPAAGPPSSHRGTGRRGRGVASQVSARGGAGPSAESG